MKIFIFLFLFFATPAQAKSIRTVTVGDGALINVNTAIGFSTILEFSSKPISAVLGDQDGFKLEYLGNSITIKPLVPHAKSNLFVFTEFERFNCRLETVSSGAVDYIVHIKTKEKSYPVESERMDENVREEPAVPIHRSSSYDGITLAVNSIKYAQNAVILDFSISTKNKSYTFVPRSIGVRQKGKYLSVESLYLDRLNLNVDTSPIQGKIALQVDDFKSTLPVMVVFAVPDFRKKSGVHRIEVFVKGK